MSFLIGLVIIITLGFIIALVYNVWRQEKSKKWGWLEQSK